MALKRCASAVHSAGNRRPFASIRVHDAHVSSQVHTHAPFSPRRVDPVSRNSAFPSTL